MISVLYLCQGPIRAGVLYGLKSIPVPTKMQTFSIIVLIAFVYYAPTIYKKIVNNFKVSMNP